MTLRFYLVPAVQCERPDGEGGWVPRPNSRCAKYFSRSSIPGSGEARWAGMDYGADNVYLVLADVTAQQHKQLTNQLDVTLIVA